MSYRKKRVHRGGAESQRQARRRQSQNLRALRKWRALRKTAFGKAEVMRVTKGSENVFVDCGFPLAEAESLRIRAKMTMALTGYIRERKITQSRAARIMGVSQPRISDLVRGKIGLFTIDTLVNMVAAAGLKVDVDITPGRP